MGDVSFKGANEVVFHSNILLPTEGLRIPDGVRLIACCTDKDEGVLGSESSQQVPNKCLVSKNAIQSTPNNIHCEGNMKVKREGKTPKTSVKVPQSHYRS